MKRVFTNVALVLAWGLVSFVWFETWLAAVETRDSFALPRTYLALLLVLSLATVVLAVRRTDRLRIVFESAALLALPAWGYEENRLISSDPCNDASHLFAVPEINGVFIAYAMTVVAYAAARSRPAGFAGIAESFVSGLLIFGVVLVGVMAVHSAPLLPFGVVYFAVGLPLIAPLEVVGLYGLLLLRRQRTAAVRPRWGSSFAVAVGALLAYVAAQALWLKSMAGALQVLTRTYGGVFSQLPRAPPCHEHYLCTVAAQGNPRLVGPLRAGRRRGEPIVVNRQLAIANAFEDLLHERWPRAARRIRTAYDRLGLPLSRCIRRRWAADLTYLLMKPAEWSFLAVLRRFDADPEARIDRMYR